MNITTKDEMKKEKNIKNLIEVDAVFKVLTSELFELFKMLWNLKTNEHLNPASCSLFGHSHRSKTVPRS